MWNIYTGIDPAGAVLGICGYNFQALAIDASSERMPKRVLDHAG
jgi:hypothetical protein